MVYTNCRRGSSWCARFIVLAVLAAANNTGAAEETGDFAWPAATSQTKPWTRWWWHGSAVDNANITKQLEAYAAAGLGGVEITPIYGVRGTEAQFLPYLSPAWMDALEHTLAEAERLGLGVDMATGNGWPFGGPWIEGEAACRDLVLKKYRLAGGERLSEAVTVVQEPLARAIGRRVTIGELKEPIAANADLQGLALEQVRFAKPLPLAALVARQKDGPTIQLNLADKVGATGKLDWTAPPGEWTLYAAFSGWHGKMVERAGPGGEGNVIDHFSGDALAAYLKKFDEAFADRNVKSLRAFFNDSYEVDDASGQADWTPRFFAEFQERRGYDLRLELPALAGEGDPDRVGRVLCDYRETISDLLLDEFTTPWHDWAAGHDAIVRNQAHGSPANLLDLYAASDIPECEGTDRIAFITAASAAHVTGKRLVSAEACTWMDEHFVETLAEAKTWVDRYFLGGVNHICYHGTPYTPEGDKWPGWMFYASAHFGTTNSLWPHFHALNEYVTRCQTWLQAGEPDADVLVYYPIHDQWSQVGGPRLQHFDGSMKGNAARACAQRLLDAGYQVDFISDRQLSSAFVADDVLQTKFAKYHAIVVPSCRALPGLTFFRLVRLVDKGATVVFEGELPAELPGLAKNTDPLHREVLAYVRQVNGGAHPQGGESIATGKGHIVVGSAPNALVAAKIHGEPLVEQGLQFTRRRLDDGFIYFIANPTDKTIATTLMLNKSRAWNFRYDPLTGCAGIVGAKNAPIKLGPGESTFLRTIDLVEGTKPAQEGLFPPYRAAGDSQSPSGPWKLQFLSGGPSLPAEASMPKPKSWTTLPGADVQAFSGTARYSTTFDWPNADRPLELDLGEVRESAAVYVNDKLVATLFAPPFKVVIEAKQLKPGVNTLAVEVANLMANRIAAMEQAGDASWKKFYNINFPSKGPAIRGAPNSNAGPDRLFTAKNWQPWPSGLLGPVTLTPVVLGKIVGE